MFSVAGVNCLRTRTVPVRSSSTFWPLILALGTTGRRKSKGCAIIHAAYDTNKQRTQSCRTQSRRKLKSVQAVRRQTVTRFHPPVASQRPRTLGSTQESHSIQDLHLQRTSQFTNPSTPLEGLSVWRRRKLVRCRSHTGLPHGNIHLPELHHNFDLQNCGNPHAQAQASTRTFLFYFAAKEGSDFAKRLLVAFNSIIFSLASSES